MSKKTVENNDQTAFQKHMETLKKDYPVNYSIYTDLSKITPEQSTLQITSEWKILKPKITKILKNHLPDKK
tara:strand:+ start:2381 stop:2593 length:213 start_codon:yes stop_codon:yes gene_type:complete